MFSDLAGSSSNSMIEPSAEVVAYPGLLPPALPASVEAWQDAVVRVSVERVSSRTRDLQGLVVADGAVLTVLDHRWEISSLAVEVSGRGVFAAELERFDPRTGAALLTIQAEDLTVAPGYRGRVAHGEPVLFLVRDEDGGELVVKETYASPSLNAPDHLFALRSDYTPPYQRGTVVVTADGTPIGLAGSVCFWSTAYLGAGTSYPKSKRNRLKSFKPRDGDPPKTTDDDPGNPSVDFHAERRSNTTHQSATDPEARLLRKGKVKEAKLVFMAHALMENRHGLLVDFQTTQATGTAERDTVPVLVDQARSRVKGPPSLSPPLILATTPGGDASRLFPTIEPPGDSLRLNHGCTFVRADRLGELTVGHGSGRDGVQPYLGPGQFVSAHLDGEAEAITRSQ